MEGARKQRRRRKRKKQEIQGWAGALLPVTRYWEQCRGWDHQQIPLEYAKLRAVPRQLHYSAVVAPVTAAVDCRRELQAPMEENMESVMPD